MSSDGFQRACAVVDAGVGTAYPGAVLRVSMRGRVLIEHAAGTTALPGVASPVTPVRPDTIFDLASLTKPLVTVPLLYRLFGEGRLAPDDPAGRFVPELANTPWAGATIARLMDHTSGLPAWRPFAAKLVASSGEAIAGTPSAVDSVLRRIAAESPAAAPGVVCTYSDLGYILLGRIVEAVTGESLDAAFRRLVAVPLGLDRAFFVPVRGGVASAPPVPAGDVAATERCPTRGRVLRGEVHDDNAWVLGGVAGHAGLFADAAAVDRIATALVAAWAGEDASLFVPGVVRDAWTARAAPAGATRVRGFDTPSPAGSLAGDRAPAGTVGHLGFTGTSVWMHPSSGMVIVLLTNRVHPTRANEALRAVRPAAHDAVWDALTTLAGGHP